MRLRTRLEFRLQEQPEEPAAARAFARWNREGRRLRRALEPVRDADVYLARLGRLRETLINPDGNEAPCSPRCLRQIGKLEGRLKQQRRKGIDRLGAFMDAHGKRLNRLSEEIESALAPGPASNGDSPIEKALQICAGLAGEVSSLDAVNLHEFRKRLKQALYLAEISAPADPAAKRLAITLKKMHLAAGEWHDWETLASQAAGVLSGHGRTDGLLPVLSRQAEDALERALRVCRRTTASLLKNWGTNPASPQRKPVATAPVNPSRSEEPSLRIAS